jgi:hypothetical protein
VILFFVFVQDCRVFRDLYRGIFELSGSMRFGLSGCPARMAKSCTGSVGRDKLDIFFGRFVAAGTYNLWWPASQ